MSDVRSGISSVAYNELNLPQSVTFADGEADYLYLSDGTKLAALKDGSGLIYCGSMVFSCSFSGTAPAVDFESTGFSAGRMVKNDYLCSVRVVTDARGEVLERNDYSGFGKRLANSAVTPAAGSANRYRFSGKEEQGFAGVPWQDFGARMYDPDLARWTTPDPLAEKYPGISPYVYCNDNPVNFVDPDGRVVRKSIFKIGKSVIKTAIAGKKVNIKKIVQSEVFDTIEDVRTILDSDASDFERGIATVDLLTGFGDEVKWFAKAVGVSDAIVDGAKASERSVSNTLIETTIDILPENQISRELLDKPNKRGNAFVFKEDGTAVEIHHAGQR